MRILATSNASYVPPRGGSTRSNLVWLDYLASQGHQVWVVAPSIVRDTEAKRARVSADLKDQRIRVNRVKTDPFLGFEELRQGEITVYSVKDSSRLRHVLREKIQQLRPDWVLVSSEDFGQTLLAESHEAAPGRVVYLAHTPQMFPFGPASLHRNEQGARLVRNSAGIVAIGNHTADYIEEHLGRRPTVIHPPVYGSPPYKRRDPDADGLITMVNPSAVKGISIFLALAERFPQYRFGALRGWGTTEEHLETLRRHQNVELLSKVRHIETVLKKTKILLMPALWYEGFGLIVMEAMLRGVPVISSDQGSLVEAKMDTGYVIPVRPIERFTTLFDEHRMPVPVVPDQNIEPWAAALDELMTDRNAYRKASDAARDAAMRFVPGVKASAFEDYLLGLERSAAAAEAAPAKPAASPRQSLESLSPEKRALLLQRMREKRGAS